VSGKTRVDRRRFSLAALKAAFIVLLLVLALGWLWWIR